MAGVQGGAGPVNLFRSCGCAARLRGLLRPSARDAARSGGSCCFGKRYHDRSHHHLRTRLYLAGRAGCLARCRGRFGRGANHLPPGPTVSLSEDRSPAKSSVCWRSRRVQFRYTGLSRFQTRNRWKISLQLFEADTNGGTVYLADEADGRVRHPQFTAPLCDENRNSIVVTSTEEERKGWLSEVAATIHRFFPKGLQDQAMQPTGRTGR